MTKGRLLKDVAPTDTLYCHLGAHDAPASEFPIRRRGNWEEGASTSYRSYCKECHRTRNGPAAPILNRPTTSRVQRDPIDDGEVRAALGVLRDHKAQKRRERQGYVYCISDGSAVKVGYSVKPEARVSELQTGNPRELTLLASFEGTEQHEAMLHAKYIAHNILLEWFRPDPELLSEFALTKEDL